LLPPDDDDNGDVDAAVELWGLSFWVECTPERCLNARRDVGVAVVVVVVGVGVDAVGSFPPLGNAHFAESCLDTTYRDR